MMNPEFDDETPVNPFDLWEGANFKLRARVVAGFRNYDKSEFVTPSALSEDDAELEKIWNQEYSLQEFLDPKNFKSYDELNVRLTKVLGLADDSGIEESSSPSLETSEASSYPTADAASDVGGDDDSDDSLSYFSKLADEA